MRLGILGSTRGTHFMNLQQAITQGRLPASIAVVLSNRQDALILDRARSAGIPAIHVPNLGDTRETYDRKMSQHLEQHQVDVVVLIGYMRILSPWFVKIWENRVINVHPSLLPKYQGLMDLAVHQAVLDSHDSETGCTVHVVTEHVDKGPILVQKRCSVLQGDAPELLKARVQALEADALVEALLSMRRSFELPV